MNGASFLHPSQRSLRTGQIGPSGHKNEFHAAVLEGNWLEERRSFGPQPAKNCAFVANSTHHTSYLPVLGDSLKDAKPLEATVGEAPRQLIFGHGNRPFNSLVALNELTHKAPESQDILNCTQALQCERNSHRVEQSLAKKRDAHGLDFVDESQAGRPPVGHVITKDRFLTTKNVTVDAAGEFVKQMPDVLGETRKSCAFNRDHIKSLNNNMHKTRLRM